VKEKLGGSKMDAKQQDKRGILRDKVLALVEEFVKTEGGITYRDLIRVFGPGDPMNTDRVATALEQWKITLQDEQLCS
jgi:hypothetical protein